MPASPPRYRYLILPASDGLLQLAAQPITTEFREEQRAAAAAAQAATDAVPPTPSGVVGWRWRLAHWVRRLHRRHFQALGRWLDARPTWVRWIVLVPALPLIVGLALLFLLGAGLAWCGARLVGRQAAKRTSRRINAWFDLLFEGNLDAEELFSPSGPAATDDEAAAQAEASPPDSRELADQGEILPVAASMLETALALRRTRKMGYRVLAYGLPGKEDALHAAGPALVAGGWLDAWWPVFAADTLAAYLAAAAVHIPDSLLVLHEVAQLPAAQAVGFSSRPHRPVEGKAIGWGRFSSHYGRTDGLEARQLGDITGYYLHPQRVAQTTAGLPTSLVVYVADTEQPEVEAFLQANLPRIEAALAAKDLRFLFVPALTGGRAAPAAEVAALLPALRYQFPRLRTLSEATLRQAVAEAGQQTTTVSFSRALLAALGLSDVARPALLRRLESYTTGPASFGMLSLAPPPGLDAVGRRAWLEQQLAYYLEHVGGYIDDYPRFSLASGPPGYDADWQFGAEGQALPPELLAELAALEARDGPAVLARLLLHLAAHLHAEQPALLAAVAPLLPPAVPALASAPARLLPRDLRPGAPALTDLSPLVITPDLRLLLPAYGNPEVVLTPLPKALYLFFLTQPPDGLMFHDLVDHQPALLAWYQRLQPGLELDVAQTRIRELTDVRQNSVNEKCSRLKAAFVALLPEPLAAQYYVTGQRGGCKGVLLPRHLVQWPTGAGPGPTSLQP